MQFDVGCLSELPDDKLKEISATLVTRIKDVKRKIGVLIKNDKHLMSMWVTKLGVDPPKALPEQITEIRNQRKREFEIALLSNPEAFVTFQVNSFLITLNDEIRAERIRRTPIKSKS